MISEEKASQGREILQGTARQRKKKTKEKKGDGATEL